METMAAGLPKAIIMFTKDVLNYRLTPRISGARVRARVLLYSELVNLKYAGFFILVAIWLMTSCAFASTIATAAELTHNSITLANFPNPFDSRYSQTKIFILTTYPKDSFFHVKIFDVFGYPVKDYGYVEGGSVIVWDGSDDSGRKVAKGGYLCVVFSQDGNVSAIKKIGVLH